MKKLLKRIKLHSKSLTLRVILVMILLVIPLNIWGIFTVSQMQEHLYTEARNSIYSIGQLTMSELDSRMASADAYLMDTLVNENTFFATVLNQKGDNEFYHAVYNIHKNLRTRAASGNDAEIYFLYTPALDYGDVVFNTQFSIDQSKVKAALDDLIRDGSYQIERRWVLISYDEELWLMRCLQRNGLYYGAMIDIGLFYDNVYGGVGFNTVELEMVSNADAKMAYDKAKIVTFCNSSETDVQLCISVDTQEITQNLPFLQRAGVGISIIFCCALPLIIFFLYKWLLQPVNTLLKAMNMVQTGDLDYQIEEKAKSNEFGALYYNFNNMITAQVEMNKEIVEKETYARKMEFQTLQLQIRPHFLLNFFNLLYGLIATKKIESSQKLILYLSDYFRYIFRSGKDMELYEKEIGLIINYIGVARLRYPFISFEEEHDDDVLNVEVPPLLIHNFIENVLKHGLKVKGMTNIRLEASYQDSTAEFVIKDDGRGIPAEEVGAINAGKFEKKDSSVHVGLQNSWQRIKYFYGEEAKLKVESVLGEGTKVTIQVPYHISEGKDSIGIGEDNQ